MATNSDDQVLRNRLLDEPSVQPNDTRAELQNERQDAQELRHRLRGVEGVAPEDTRAELREAMTQTQQERAAREERDEEEERRRETRRQTEAAQQAQGERDYALELAALLAAAATTRSQQEMANGFEQRDLVFSDAETDGAAAALPPPLVRQWAERDMMDLEGLEGTKRSIALDRVADNMQRVPGYRDVVGRQAPHIFKAAEERAAANSQRAAEKDARKESEFDTRPAPPAAIKAEQASAQAAVDSGLQSQLDEDLRQRARREKEQAEANTVDVARTGKELDRGEFIKPRQIEHAYTEVEGKYYAKDSNRVMFEDRGNKLATSTTNKAVVADMVALAKAKGWESGKVSGDRDFRREAWLQFESQGLPMQGYTPTKADLAALETLRQERSKNTITPLQERKPAELDRKASEPLTRAPRHDLNKNQASIHDAAMKALTVNLSELHKRPELRDRTEEEMQKLAYWRGVVGESNRLQPEAVRKEALARFDKQAEDPQFVRRLSQETEPKVQEKTTERVQARDTQEQSL